MQFSITQPPQMLTENAVAQLTGLSKGTLRTWRCRRKGPPFRKLGGRVVYDAADVTAWIESHPRTECSR